MGDGGALSFITGDKVEVRSDEEGFQGAWFEATIVRIMPRVQRYTVEYDSLLAGGNPPGRKLRETVEWRYVRPRPPPELGHAPRFAINEAVDAYFQDGWWVGIVSKVASAARKERGRPRKSVEGEDRYVVYFPNTKDEIEFGTSELRRHLEWVDEKWVSQETCKQQAEAALTKGVLVEVSSDEEGFRGVWFAAKIIESIGSKIFLVEYCDLKTDDGEELLREQIDSLHIRPQPPSTRIAGFKLLEEVDAWHNDGWWVGVISKVLKDSRYMVYFKQSNEEMEFGHHELRLHHDWNNGRWVRSLEALKG